MAHMLVTGGAGFIGSHLVDALLAQGHTVTVLDDFSSGRRENLPGHPQLHLIERDLLSVDSLPAGIHAIAHLAAIPSVNDSWSRLREAHDANLTATVHLLELCRAAQIPRIVFASSAAVYGDPQQLPVSEDHPQSPLSPYGLQKLCSEQYGRLLAQQGSLSFVALRFFNVYGPRQLASSPYSGVISRFVDDIRTTRQVTIHGDGSQTRDFVYVKDLVQGISRALQLEPNATRCLTCNLGTGSSVSIKQLYETLDRLLGGRSTAHYHEARTGDIRDSQADITAARKHLGYEPGWSLQEGLAELLAGSTAPAP